MIYLDAKTFILYLFRFSFIGSDRMYFVEWDQTAMVLIPYEAVEKAKKNPDLIFVGEL